MSDLEVTKTTLPGKAICIKMVGSIDSYTVSKLDRTLEQLFRQKRFYMLVDLSTVDYISSAGLGVLIGALQRVDFERGRLILINPTKDVMEVFENVGLQGVFTFVESVEKGQVLIAEASSL